MFLETRGNESYVTKVILVKSPHDGIVRDAP
jgi:hypothetical protein